MGKWKLQYAGTMCNVYFKSQKKSFIFFILTTIYPILYLIAWNSTINIAILLTQRNKDPVHSWNFWFHFSIFPFQCKNLGNLLKSYTFFKKWIKIYGNDYTNRLVSSFVTFFYRNLKKDIYKFKYYIIG